jgi:hypothetical protein
MVVTRPDAETLDGRRAFHPHPAQGIAVARLCHPKRQCVRVDDRAPSARLPARISCKQEEVWNCAPHLDQTDDAPGSDAPEVVDDG